MKITQLIFDTFTNGSERLDFSNVDVDLRGRLGRLLNGDRFVDERIMTDMCRALNAQWLDIRSPKRSLEHLCCQESGAELVVKKLDPRFALPATCVLLMETGLVGNVAGEQIPIYLRVKIQEKGLARKGSILQQQRAGMRREVTQFVFADATGEPLSGFYDLPFTFRNLPEFTDAFCKCVGGYYDGRKFNAAIVKSWFRRGQPRSLPIELDSGLTSLDGEPLTLRIDPVAALDQEDEQLFKPPCDVKILKGGLEYNVVDFMPEFYKTVSKTAFVKSWRALVDMAENGEPWDVELSDEKTARKSLESYLKITFNKLQQQDEEGVHRSLLKRNGDKDLIFCTGLVSRTRNGNAGSFIYGYCSDMRDGRYERLEWITRSDPRSGAESDERFCDNHNLPWPALWTTHPEELVYQYHLGSPRNEYGEKGAKGFAFHHMIDCHPERFPQRYLTSRDNGDGKPMVVNRSKLMKDVEQAWKSAKKRLCANYKWAVPTFYSSALDQLSEDDRKYSPVCLLVPLYLDPEAKNPDVALVLRRQYKDGRPYYFAPTVLTIPMARNNARVITRLDNTWLGAECVRSAHG